MTSLLACSVLVTPGHTVRIQAERFEAPKGALTGLIGPNGAGKSTLLKAIAGIVPARGVFTLEDMLLPAPETRARARLVGYLPQGHILHWSLNVRQVVELGRLPWAGRWRSGKTDCKAVDRAMERVGIQGLGKRDATTLSGGEKAKVMLARVLATETPVILADEPTANLDPAHQIAVCELLADLARRENRSVTIVLHDLCLAARFCDHIAIMDKGCLGLSGPPEDALVPSVIDPVYGVSFTNIKIGTFPVILAGSLTTRSGPSIIGDHSSQK
ncbi:MULTISPECIES: ABC transporter ATP-binding protein [unclassified Haematospirillum]|uniref:ABC transporter ATP-binding protein n=1 Tax=unclassified Haematospirillum TaxID=2622088 RepID=UPI00143C8030|nr:MULTISPECIES: ABC transporter ATP-binding protein [unclassified Haematospirillum]NKD55882.1 ABC transporter ATP-binding protein [Haematospirillum sp. H4890]NKD75911.1 ABC transporter ATP-binding protein [Haematospirillum sp. H4485]NKD88777.1 ABC transporter ATP-binding protein [Haematospirillum sp. 15-248]